MIHGCQRAQHVGQGFLITHIGNLAIGVGAVEPLHSRLDLVGGG